MKTNVGFLLILQRQLWLSIGEEICRNKLESISQNSQETAHTALWRYAGKTLFSGDFMGHIPFLKKKEKKRERFKVQKQTKTPTTEIFTMNHVIGQRRLVRRFTDVYFCISSCEKNAFWAALGFRLQYFEWPLGGIAAPSYFGSLRLMLTQPTFWLRQFTNRQIPSLDKRQHTRSTYVCTLLTLMSLRESHVLKCNKKIQVLLKTTQINSALFCN